MPAWADNQFFTALIAAVIGAAATFVAMRFSRVTERKKLTLEVIVEKIWDKDYILCERRLAHFRHFIETATIDEFQNHSEPAPPRIQASASSVSTRSAPPAETEESTSSTLSVRIVNAEESPFELAPDVVRSILNYYEIMAIGIRDQILDEMICKRYMYGEFLRNWRSCKQIIEQIRTRANNDRIYREVENLAKRWARIPPKPETAWLMYIRGWY